MLVEWAAYIAASLGQRGCEDGSRSTVTPGVRSSDTPFLFVKVELEINP